MAHFAKLNDNNIVEQVIVVNNEVLLDSEGVEREALGVAFCEETFGGRWIQTSYSAAFRRSFAGIGAYYDPVTDEFKEPTKPVEEPVND